MTLTMTQLFAALTAVDKLGVDHGTSAGTWVFDGNTSDADYAAWRQMLNEGDPRVGDAYAAPLSGEWADGLTPQTLVELLDLDADDLTFDEIDDICHRYETAHMEAWTEEIERTVTAVLNAQVTA